MLFSKPDATIGCVAVAPFLPQPSAKRISALTGYTICKQILAVRGLTYPSAWMANHFLKPLIV